MGSLVKHLRKTFAEVVNSTCGAIPFADHHQNQSIKNFLQIYEKLQSIKENMDSNPSIITKTSQNWLRRVNQMMEEDQKLRELINDIKKRRKWCNFKMMNQMAEEMSKKIQGLLNDKPKDYTIREHVIRVDSKSISNERSFLRSRVDSLKQEIVAKLDDDRVDAVGVFGVRGIGKTMMANEISGNRKYDAIVYVKITKTCDIRYIQNDIANKIGLSLVDEYDVKHRADRLYGKLKEERQSDNKIKKLIILDNILAKIDLSKIGIPISSLASTQDEFSYKLLLISREKKVLQDIGVQVENIFEMQPLDENESRELFRREIGLNIGEDGMNKELQNVEKILLEKCEGKPRDIVELAKLLKYEDFSMWEHLAIEIAPNDATIGSVHPHAYSNLRIKYMLKGGEDRRKFFFLACSFPYGTTISIRDMIRYGMGLGLFGVKNYTKAREQAVMWIEEFILASLLSDDCPGDHIKINDDIRMSAISLAEKDGDPIMINTRTHWLDEDTLKLFTMISLTSSNNHSSLEEMESNKLKLLMLDYSQPKLFGDEFFQGIKKLNVLALKGMEFTNGLPKSINKLKNLRMLHLENCKLMFGGIVEIGECVNLVILSLRGSEFYELPENIMRKLYNIRSLDLSKSKIHGRISIEGVSSNLEELILSFASANDDQNQKNVANLSNMGYLKVLEMHLYYDRLLDKKIVENLDQFRILISDKSGGWSDLMNTYELTKSCRILQLSWIESLMMDENMNESLIVLLLRAECLILKQFGKLPTFIYSMVEENLEHLVMIDCDLDQPLDSKWKSLECLESLYLVNLPCLKTMVDYGVLFLNLKVLVLWSVPELKFYVLPTHSLPKFLSVIIVMKCPNLSFILGETTHKLENSNYSLPFLELLLLHQLTKLESLLEVLSTPELNPINLPQTSTTLFHKMLRFQSLKEVDLDMCNTITNLWDLVCTESYYISSFQNLKKLTISKCDQLESLGSIYVISSLTQLQNLYVKSCPKLTTLFSNKILEHYQQHDASEILEILVLFPSLQTLTLFDCPNLQSILLGAQIYVVDLPSLLNVKIRDCPKLQFLTSHSLKTPKLSVVDVDSEKYFMQGFVDV